MILLVQVLSILDFQSFLGKRLHDFEGQETENINNVV